MEDKPKQNQVMDIQPPKQPETAVPVEQTAVQSEVAASVSAAPEEAKEPETPAEVTTDGSINDVKEAPTEESTGDHVEERAPTPTAQSPLLAAAAQQPHKGHTPVLAIISALVVSGVLAGLTVYTFMNSDKPKDSTTAQTESVGIPKVDAAKSADVDDLNSIIDQDMKAIDEAADYSDAAVSDTTLGL